MKLCRHLPKTDDEIGLSEIEKRLFGAVVVQHDFAPPALCARIATMDWKWALFWWVAGALSAVPVFWLLGLGWVWLAPWVACVRDILPDKPQDDPPCRPRFPP